MHTADTESMDTKVVVDDLSPDTWHEFQVAAITAPGVGAVSQPSHPCLTDRAPKLLRDVERTARAVRTLRERLQRKRETLMELAGERTLGATGVGRDAKNALRARRRLERQIAQIESALSVVEAEHGELQKEARVQRELRRKALGGRIAREVDDEGRGSDGRSDEDGREGDSRQQEAAAASPSEDAAVTRELTRRTRKLRSLGVYAKLFLDDDVRAEPVYAPFDREVVRTLLHRSLHREVRAGEMRAYFDLALNRVRSAASHNVFDRFGERELREHALHFARLDGDHDGVLEYMDFCRLMLLQSKRAQMTYHEDELRRMFSKADLNDDGVLDLNEFLFVFQLQRPGTAPGTPPATCSSSLLSAAAAGGEGGEGGDAESSDSARSSCSCSSSYYEYEYEYRDQNVGGGAYSDYGTHSNASTTTSSMLKGIRTI